MRRALVLVLSMLASASSAHELVIEAEDFHVVRGPFRIIGRNEAYYAATLSNTFSSRQRLLSAPADGPTAEAVHDVQIPVAGRYRIWTRYELPSDWTAEHVVRIEQRGRPAWQRTYGRSDSNKLWPFGKGLTPMAHFSWGSGDNVVWEPSDPIELAAGTAHIRLVAGAQETASRVRGGARRNLDAILITSDLDDGIRDAAKQTWHTLDRWLDQRGQCWIRVQAATDAPAPLTVSFRVMTHSPYMQKREPLPPDVGPLAPGARSAWLPIGQAFDTLNMQELAITAKPPSTTTSKGASFTVELAADEHGRRSLGRFQLHDDEQPTLWLEVPADVRREPIRTLQSWHEELLAYLRSLPSHGRVPTQLPVDGIMGDHWHGWGGTPIARLEQLREETGLLLGRNTFARDLLPPELQKSAPHAHRTIDLRGLAPAALETKLRELAAKGALDDVDLISLGDEIGVRAGSPDDAKDVSAYRDWLRAQKAPLDAATATLVVEPGGDPRAYYWSARFRSERGIARLKELTDAVHRVRRDLQTGANFSPHPDYWPRSDGWFDTFRRGGMTTPWSEDWTFQVPVASPEIVGYLADAMRSAVHGGAIEMYTMPHWPGQTARDLTLSFYSALAHGNKRINFFAAQPIYDYTENWVDWTARDTWKAIFDLTHDLGTADDLIATGRVRAPRVALVASEVNDLWDEAREQSLANFERQNVWYALRQAQIPVDFVTEEELAGRETRRYDVLIAVGDHLARKVAAPLRKWVVDGGTLVTVGAPLRDENDQPSGVLAELFGVRAATVEQGEKKCWAKECLAWLPPLATVETVDGKLVHLAAYGARTHLEPSSDATVRARFSDGTPAIVDRKLGRGAVRVFAFGPGSAWLRPAMPREPFARGTTDAAFNHFLPSAFDAAAQSLLLESIEPALKPRPVIVEAGEHTNVDAMVIDAPGGAVVPIASYAEGSLAHATVKVLLDGDFTSVAAARAGALTATRDGGYLVVTLPIDRADLLVFRR